MTETITIPRSGRRPLRFTVTRIAEAGTSPDQGHSDYSGQTGIWHTAAVYRRPRGGFIIAYALHSQWQGSHDEHRAWRADSLDAVADIIEAELPTVVADELLSELDIAEDLDAEVSP